MGIGVFGRLDGEDPARSSGAAADPSGNGAGVAAFIDRGAELEGTLHAKDSVRIEGEFRGEIVSEAEVVVGEAAGIEANIRSRTVIIRGAVLGNVVATRELIVHETGRLKGNVETASLAIEKGAVFNGRTKMVRPQAIARARHSGHRADARRAGKADAAGAREAAASNATPVPVGKPAEAAAGAQRSPVHRGP